MSLRKTVVLALLVALAGCTGAGAPGGSGGETTAGPTVTTTTTTTASTSSTDPHTGRGTSHASSHLSVQATNGVENVTVTLAPDGQSASVQVEAGTERSLTEAVHECGHDVRLTVDRDGEVVFDRMVREYEYYQVTVYENETSVTHSEV
jgi:ABC-type transport system substrate-binding protein